MFDVHSLCLHLRRALGFVLAIREAMWEELVALVTTPGGGREVDLTKYGFFPQEDTLQSMRSKYVQLLDQFKQYVRLPSRAPVVPPNAMLDIVDVSNEQRIQRPAGVAEKQKPYVPH